MRSGRRRGPSARATALKAALLVLDRPALSRCRPGSSRRPRSSRRRESDVGPDAVTFRVDLPSLLLVLVVVPLVAGLATWAGGRLRSWVRPKRPDVFAFGE